MNQSKERLQEILSKNLRLFGGPSTDQIDNSRGRIRQLLAARTKSALYEVAPVKAGGGSLRFGLLAAALIILAVALSVTFLRDPRGVAQVEIADGSLYSVSAEIMQPLRPNDVIDNGQLIRSTSESGNLIRLQDGSLVEVRTQSELFFSDADDGIRIRLNKGGVLVTAAKQQSGQHLWVQTRDFTVSVVGTVFLVNAEEEGSRVAVIAGEVRVRQGETEQSLRPGEQVASNPSMPSPPVSEEISWSRNAEAHMALLMQSNPATGTPRTAPRLEFASITIKKALRGPGPLGVTCHGVDGVSSARWGTYGASPDVSIYPVKAPQGRCIGNGVGLVQLIEFAYGVPREVISGAPDWDRPAPGLPNGFQIEAIAGDSSMATREQLKQMLQSMLADRFKLTLHTEARDISGYALRIAKDGSKLKAVGASEQLSPWFDSTEGVKHAISGRSDLVEFAQFLGSIAQLGSGWERAVVLDKTALTGVYEYNLVLPGPGPSQLNAATLSAALEDQLGLQLQVEKVAIEGLVIDQAEKPSEN